MDEPNSLLKLQREVMKIDNRYWKRIMEKRREDGKGKNSASNTNNSKKQTLTESSSTNTSKPATSSTSNQNQSSQSKSRPKNSNNKPADNKGKNPLVDKLNKSRKLTLAEKERRKKNGLCMFCGAKGHLINDCDKRKQAEAKARAAKTSTSEPTAEASESKK